VPVDEIGQEVPGEDYPFGEWFVGDPAGPALIQGTDGLTIPGQNQLLFGVLADSVTAEEFEEFIDVVEFDGTGPLTFQVPVFLGPGESNFTTLRPTTTGTPSTATTWTVSRTAGPLTKNASYTFDEILAAFVGTDASVLAFGVFVDPGETAVLRSVTVDDQVWSFATPAAPVTPPTAPVAPAAQAPAAQAPVATPVRAAATFTG
jgi:hypothetical protein